MSTKKSRYNNVQFPIKVEMKNKTQILKKMAAINYLSSEEVKICCMICGISLVSRHTKDLPEGKLLFNL